MAIQDIVESVRKVLPGEKKKPQLTREHALAAQPVRNPSLKWRESDEGEAIIVLPRRTDWVGKFLAWMFFVPESRPIALDDVGTFVWTNCDGTHNVAEMVELLCDEYKLGTREAELSLTQFLQTLAKRGMVGFLVPKEIADELGAKEKRLLGLEEIGATEEDLRKAQQAAEDEDQDEDDETSGEDE